MSAKVGRGNGRVQSVPLVSLENSYVRVHPLTSQIPMNQKQKYEAIS